MNELGAGVRAVAGGKQMLECADCAAGVGVSEWLRVEVRDLSSCNSVSRRVRGLHG